MKTFNRNKQDKQWEGGRKDVNRREWKKGGLENKLKEPEGE